MGENPWASEHVSQPMDKAIPQPVTDALGFTEPFSSQPSMVGGGEGLLSSSDLAGAVAEAAAAGDAALAGIETAEATAAEATTADATAAEAATAPEGDYSGFGAAFGGASVPAGDTGTSSGAFSYVGGELVMGRRVLVPQLSHLGHDLLPLSLITVESFQTASSHSTYPLLPNLLLLFIAVLYCIFIMQYTASVTVN